VSIRVSVQVWDADFPTSGMKLVAMKLADCANDDGDNIFPSSDRVERETQLGRSTVLEYLADMEASGLLVVTQRAYGNKRGKSTTIRKFALDRLKALREGALVWDQTDVKTKSGKSRKAWRLIARPADGPLPVQPLDGHPSSCWTGTRPADGQVPVQLMDPPIEEPSKGNCPSHPSDAGVGREGWADGWDEATRGVVESELRRSATASHVATNFVDAVRGLLRPSKGVDGPAYVRQLSARLRDFKPSSPPT
jgi:hypothetical protein